MSVSVSSLSSALGTIIKGLPKVATIHIWQLVRLQPFVAILKLKKVLPCESLIGIYQYSILYHKQ